MRTRQERIVTLWLVGSVVLLILGAGAAWSGVLLGIGFLSLVLALVYMLLDNVAHQPRQDVAPRLQEASLQEANNPWIVYNQARGEKTMRNFLIRSYQRKR